MADIDQKYFPTLDGLRAICIALVIFVHIPKTTGSVLQLLPAWVGVDIFFVISGFLITTLLFREEAANGKVDLYAFYVRRFFRIIPLYLLILTFYVITASTNPIRWAAMRQVLPYYLTFMNDLVASKLDAVGNFAGFTIVPFGATWSLGIEEKFYLVWPLLAFSFFQKKFRLWLLPLLYAGIAFLPFRMFRSYFGLLLGCCLAILLAGGLLNKTRVLVGKAPVSLIALLVFGSMALVRMNEQWIFLFSFFVTVLLCSLVTTESWMARVLSWRWMIWIGRRSYSMYLIQAIILSAIESFIKPTTVLRQLAITVLGIGGSALGADLLYRFVEEPSRLYGKRFLRGRGEPSSSISPGVLEKLGK